MASGIVEQTSQAKQGQQQRGGAEGARGKLVQRLLASSPNLPAFVADLLSTQAMVVAGTEAAAFMVEPAQESFGLRPVAHLRPDDASEEVRSAAIKAFIQLVRPCVEQNREGAFEVGAADDAGEMQYCLATVLRNQGEAVGVTAVVTRCRNMDRAKQRLASLELVAGYFELFSLRQSADEARLQASGHQGVLQLLAAVATVEGFEAGARNLTNELATRTGASRVALGWVKGERIKVRALSHTEKFDKKQELLQQTIRVMEECLDQEQIVYFDPDGSGSETVKREAESYSRANGNCIVLSAPMRRGTEVVGVITLELPADRKPDGSTTTLLSIASDVLTPQLYDRHENDRWIWVKMGHSLQRLAKATVGPQHTLAKIIVSAVLLAIVLLVAIKPMYRVSAPFEFAAVEKRALVAPARGFIARELPKIDGEDIRPGTKVKAGDLLASLDTTELELKLIEARTRAAAYTKESVDKMREGKQAESQIAAKQAEAEMASADLYAYQIKQSQIVSPLDGRVIKGDLRQRRGTPVDAYEPLFEVAQTDQLEVEASLAERDIQMVQVGQKGLIRTSGRPGETFNFTVTRIIPLGEPKDGANIFRVYGKLDSQDPQWLPGMAGDARIEIENKSLFWIWTHRFADFLTLKLWW